MENKEKTNIDRELEDLSPTLSKLRREKDGFESPAHYFDYLTNSILEQTSLLKTETATIPTVARSSWWQRLFRPQFVGSLMGVALLLIAVVQLWPTSNTDDPTDLTVQEMASYVNQHIEDFEMDLLLEEISLEEVTELEIESEMVEEFLQENLEEVDLHALEQLL